MPPAGFTVTEIVYPPPTDLTQAGQAQPLAVFEREFAIGVVVSVPANAPPGDVVVPARLRYQACDAQLCYAPVTAATEWTPAGRRRGHRCHAAAGDGVRRDRVRHGTRPPRRHGRPAPASRPRPARLGRAQRPGRARRLRRAGRSTGGYLPASAISCSSCATPRPASSRAGLFEGRGPLAILLVVLLGGLALNLTPCVLPMIPINLAIIGAGAQAGSRSARLSPRLGLRRRDGRRLWRARADRHPDRRHLRHDQRVAVVQPRHRRAVRRARRWRCSTCC